MQKSCESEEANKLDFATGSSPSLYLVPSSVPKTWYPCI